MLVSWEVYIGQTASRFPMKKKNFLSPFNISGINEPEKKRNFSYFNDSF